MSFMEIGLIVINVILAVIYFSMLISYYSQVRDINEYERLAKLMNRFSIDSNDDKTLMEIARLAEKLQNVALHRQMRLNLMLVLTTSWAFAGLISPYVLMLFGWQLSGLGTIGIMLIHMYFIDNHGRMFFFDDLPEHIRNKPDESTN